MTATPLSGIRVVDLSSVVVGPVCSLRLAHYGAEVIKVEAPAGDLMRGLGGASPTGQHSGAYLHFNRAKRAIALDLKQRDGLRALLALVRTADVFLSNMRPAALARLGLGAATLRADQPALVHATITGFGPGGRYRSLPAYDSVLQGVSGVAGVMAARDGKAAYVPLLLCDHVTGEIAAGAIAAALAERARTGIGGAIEVPMFETMAAFVLQEHLARASFVPPLGPSGDKRMLDAGAAPLQTSDGSISVTVNTDRQAAAFLTAVGRADAIDDPRFRTVADRVANMAEWFALRDAALLDATTDDWLARFRAADIPAMPCHTLDTLVDDPHLTEVGLLGREQHPLEGEVVRIRPTILFDGNTAPPGAPAGPIGAATVDVLAEAGLSPDEIAALLESGAGVQQPIKEEQADGIAGPSA